MAYDPTKPVNNAPIVSSELRNQLNALNDSLTSVAAQVDAFPASDGLTDRVTDLSARNVDSLPTLTLTISNPPTQAQVQAILAKLNELVTGLHH